jgi:hypothetical protein
MKQISNDLFGNKNSDLPSCNTVPQSSELPQSTLFKQCNREQNFSYGQPNVTGGIFNSSALARNSV